MIILTVYRAQARSKRNACKIFEVMLCRKAVRVRGRLKKILKWVSNKLGESLRLTLLDDVMFNSTFRYHQI